ncbi:MAG: hypothetical protein OXG79_12435 [Chloroflexi bacterium]|nr:hypothetical protein [Chloroflexota bacterium]
MTLSATAVAIEDVVIACAREGGGVEVLPGNDPSGWRDPPGLYGTVLLITEGESGVPYSRRTRNDDDSLTVTTTRTARGRYSLQWYRAGAQDAARRFAIWVRSPTGAQWLRDHRVTLNRVSDIRRLDIPLLSEVISPQDAVEWEERAGVDLDLGYLVTLEQTADSVASAEIDIVLDGVTTEEIAA